MPDVHARTTRRFFGWANLLLLFFIYGALYGFVFYGFSVVFPEMIRAEGWGRGEAAMAHTLRAFALGGFAPLVAIAVAKLGAKQTMIPGLCLGVVVMALLGTVTTELWQWTILWGLFMPASFSFGGAVPIQTTVTYWFNIRRSTALGIVLSSAAFAGFIAAPLYTVIMRETGTWRAGWVAAGICCAVSLIACLFIQNKPSDLGQFPDGVDPELAADPNSFAQSRAPRTYRTSESWVLKEVLRTPAVYLLGVCLIAQMSAVYLLTTHGVLHWTDLGFTRLQAGSVIGNLILFSGFARLPIGFVGDRVEPRWIMTVALAGMGLATLGLWKPPASFGALLAIGSLFGFCFGSIAPMFPTILGNYFGPSAFAPITGFLSPIMILIGAPVPLVAGMIYDRVHSYDLAFVYVVIFTLLATVCACGLVPPKRPVTA